MELDQDAVNLSKAIRQQESGGNFTLRGKSGEYGGYQFLPSTWDKQASKYGITSKLEQATPQEQNKVAYNQIKEWKDAGYNVGQIASMWNAGGGEPDAYKGKFSNGKESRGVNKLGVNFDVPAYATNVANIYHQMKGVVSTPVAYAYDSQNQTTDTNNVQQTQQQNTQQPESLGSKVLNFLGGITGQSGLGKDIGQGLAEGHAKQMYAETLDSWNEIKQKLQDRISALKSSGQDTTHLEDVLKKHLGSVPDIKDYLPEVSDKTASQIMSDIGQSILGIAGGELLAGGSMAARIGGGAAVGALGGALGQVQEGSTSAGDIAKSAGEGAVLGGVLGTAVEGIGYAYKGAKNLFTGIGGKTAEQIIKTAPEDVGKLSLREQRVWYANSEIENRLAAKEASVKIENEMKQTTDKLKEEMPKLSQDIKEAGSSDTLKIRPKVLQAFKDQSEKYSEIWNEQVAPAVENKIELDKLAQDVNSDERLSNDPSLQQKVKNILGIKDENVLNPTPEGEIQMNEPKPTTATVGELADKLRTLRKSISTTAKKGFRTYTPDEYAIDQAANIITKNLEEQGVDVSIAKQFWSEWAPTRDRIMREIKPFDVSGNVEIKFPKTLKDIATGKATPQTQSFVKSIEELIGEPVGDDTRQAVDKLTTRQKQVLAKKLELVSDRDNMDINKIKTRQNTLIERSDNERMARRRERIFKVLLAAGVTLGLSTATNKYIGLIK